MVANEVRSLAGKSGEAVRSTTTLIENSVRAVENGRRVADKTAQTFERVTAGSKDIVVLIEEISVATNAQSHSMEEVSTGVAQISEVVQVNSATSEESAAASAELSGQSQVLKKLISGFHLEQRYNDDDLTMRSR